MQQATDKEQLNNLYNKEIQHAEELHKLLVAEEAALKSRDIEFIHNCTEKKYELITEFESLEKQRQEMLEHSAHADSDEINLKHENLQKVIRTIQKQNRINAGIVTVSQEFARQLLSIVRGVDHDKPIYNAYGKTASVGEGQHLAKV